MPEKDLEELKAKLNMQLPYSIRSLKFNNINNESSKIF